MPGYSFFPPHPRLEAVVEAIWDHDVPDIRSAPTVVMPVVSPTLCFHYRIPPAICFQPCPSPLAENWRQPGRYRITGSQSRAARLRPNGPVGGVMVRLRPEAAARVTGAAMPRIRSTMYFVRPRCRCWMSASRRLMVRLRGSRLSSPSCCGICVMRTAPLSPITPRCCYAAIRPSPSVVLRYCSM